MKKYFKRLPKEFLDLIYLAQDTACQNNIAAYLVGGFVRDLLLGVKNLDLDIVVEGNGIKFAEDFASRLKAGLIRHRRFGTASILLKPHLKIDIATSRKEFYPQHASLPLVESGALKDDLYRRDFTINSMAIDIGCENFGKLADFFGGKADLDNKKIRILHALSFLDDPTRILRAIRFEARYGFRIEPGTLGLLRQAVKLKMLDAVEPQRIRDDLILMLKEVHPLKEIRRMAQLTGFSFISPHILVKRKTYELFMSIPKEIEWFKKAHQKKRHIDSWLVYFIALIDHLAIIQARKICSRFAFRKGEEKRILDYKRISRNLTSSLNKYNAKPSRVYSLLEPLSYEAILFLKAKFKSPNIKRHIEDFFKHYNDTRIHCRGDDLAKLGILPGPDYQKIFKKVLNARLNGLVKTKEEEIRLIKKLAGIY